MATVVFPNSNFVSFVRLEDYNNLQTDTTRLYYDLDYENITNECYYVKKTQSDTTFIQFNHNYTIGTEFNYVKIFIVDETGTETELTSSVIALKSLDDGTTQYELAINLSTYDGYYYLKGEFINTDKPIANYQSQWFEVRASYDYHLFVEWSNSGDIPTNNDGMIWGSVNQNMWIDSRMSDYTPIKETTVFQTALGKIISTQSTIGKSKIWQIKPIPAFLAETINIALGKSKFYINGERYVTENVLESERLGDISLYPYEIVLRLVELQNGIGYEDYTEKPTLTGDLPSIAEFSSSDFSSDFKITA